MRKPRSSTTTRGSTVGTRSMAAAAASSSAAVAKRLIASRFFMVGKMRSNSPASARASASAGSHPHGVDRLVVVVHGDLPGGQRGHEEPGVVALGGRLRRDPVAEVVDPVDGQAQALAPGRRQEVGPSPALELAPAWPAAGARTPGRWRPRAVARRPSPSR